MSYIHVYPEPIHFFLLENFNHHKCIIGIWTVVTKILIIHLYRNYLICEYVINFFKHHI